MFQQKDMRDQRIEPATSCTAVERGYDRANQAGIYFTMTFDRRTNGYDQDLCVLAKKSLIWIYTVFMHIHEHSRLSPQVSGGVLCFYVGCPCVCPSVRTYVRPHFVSVR